MNIQYFRGEVYMQMPNEVFVKFKNGVKIFLFAVGMGLSAPSYGHKDIVPPVLNEIQLETSDVEIALAANNIDEGAVSLYQTEAHLFSSLQDHRLDMMSKLDLDAFWTVAKEITWLDFTDSMVCYEPEERHITYDILDKTGLILHLTQYLEHPKDQVVFSIEKDDKFLLAGHTPIKEMGKKLQQVIGDLVREKG